MENKVLVFDMDGTLADFYGVVGWLSDLQAEDVRPYVVAKPLLDMDVLATALEMLKDFGYKIVITTWLAKGGSENFNNRIRKAKLDWLEKYGFPYDEIHLVKYGTTKANCTRKLSGYQILFDDNEKIRKGWNLGQAVDAKDLNKTVFEILLKEIEKRG
jgi:hypothetical protein